MDINLIVAIASLIITTIAGIYIPLYLHHKDRGRASPMVHVRLEQKGRSPRTGNRPVEQARRRKTPNNHREQA